jgi:hypothetical protein
MILANQIEIIRMAGKVQGPWGLLNISSGPLVGLITGTFLMER